VKSQFSIELGDSPSLSDSAPPAAVPPEALSIDEVRWLGMGACQLLQVRRALGGAQFDAVGPERFLVTGVGEVLLAEPATPADVSEDGPARVITAADDQFSLGRLMFRLLAGADPAPASAEEAAPRSAFAPVRSMRPECPVFLGHAVMRMLATVPSERWESLDDVYDALRGSLPTDGGAARETLGTRIRARASADDLARLDPAALVVSLADLTTDHSGWRPAPRRTPVQTRATGLIDADGAPRRVRTPIVANQSLRLVLPGEPVPESALTALLAHPWARRAGAVAATLAILGGAWTMLRPAAEQETAMAGDWRSSAGRSVLPTPSAEPVEVMDSAAGYFGRGVTADSGRRAAAAYERAVTAMLDSVTRANRAAERAAAAAPRAPSASAVLSGAAPAVLPRGAAAPATQVATARRTVTPAPTPAPTPPAIRQPAPTRPSLAATPVTRNTAVAAATRQPAPAQRIPNARDASALASARTPVTPAPRAVPPAPRALPPAPVREDPGVVATEAPITTARVSRTTQSVARGTPVTTGSVSAPSSVPRAAMAGATPVVEMPTPTEIRSQAQRIATRQRMASAFTDFFAAGEDHDVAVATRPTIVDNSPDRTRARFDVRITRYDAAGRRTTRVSTVTMDVVKQNGVVTTPAVSVAPLREP
jgi:hypothetical protein